MVEVNRNDFNRWTNQDFKVIIIAKSKITILSGLIFIKVF